LDHHFNGEAGMSTITVRGARLHNLKNVSLSIPKNKLVVFTGVSGSGKSTMAFDTLHMEGQRQYMESLGMVSYVSKPAIDSISGLSPSISVDQGLSNRSPRSTVGTATEVFTYLRVLFARVGHRPCPQCGRDVPPAHEGSLEGLWDDDGEEIPSLWDEPPGMDEAAAQETAGTGSGWVACPHCGARLPEMNMAMFSFNKPAGACPTCTGLGSIYAPDLARLLDEDKSILDGGVAGWVAIQNTYHATTLQAAGRHYGFDFNPALPIRALGPIQRDLLLYGVESQPFRGRFPGVEPPPTVAKGRFEGVVTALLRRHAEHASDVEYLEKIERLLIPQACPDCDGARLRPEARAVTVAGRPLVARAQDVSAGLRAGEAISRLPLHALAEWIADLSGALPGEEWTIAEPIVADLRERVQRLLEVGLGYLNLERATPSLAAGEAQRLRLAALLGSGLTGVLYVLDEPTIGLHPRDTPRLIAMLRALRDLGNTVLVIEHDLAMIASADWVVDFGPGGGRSGGQIVAQGAPEEVAASPESLTGRYLSGAAEIRVPAQRRRSDGPYLTIHGAREHNLRDFTVRFPLREASSAAGMLVAVTGVSGSGKSSLMLDILDRAARQRFYGATVAPGAHAGITGWEYIDKIITVDQAPIGRSTRSNAATYTDAFSAIREIFAAQPAARAQGLTAQHFSFNVPGGRCERCEGTGVLSVEMHFLPDIQVRCPACRGRRYKREVLAVRYKGHDIAQVLDLTIEEALSLFAEVPVAKARLGLMAETGMGYLQLGQPASTFSGGEAQRVKLARELSRRATGQTLYLLDEPTTGLHPADTVHLLLLLQRLVDAGNTVIVIEHNLDVVKMVDWVIELGPEGGAAGGSSLRARSKLWRMRLAPTPARCCGRI
jgi:excinuclease ABC subunit A